MGELIGLRNRKCVPCEGGNVQKLEESEANRLRQQARPGLSAARHRIADRWGVPVWIGVLGAAASAIRAAQHSTAACPACRLTGRLPVHPPCPALQCPGWRVGTNAAGEDCISQEYKVRSFRAGLDLFQR